jgi:hypothetical protein
MMFGLFKKRVAAACICEPSQQPPKASPFEQTQALTGPYVHENVALARCRKCGKEALYYSADVYDDFWQYWCLIGESERSLLIAPDESEEPERPSRAREILAHRPSLIKGPVLGFEWAPSGASAVEGPPW